MAACAGVCLATVTLRGRTTLPHPLVTMRARERPRRLTKGPAMSAENLQELFVEELRDIYDAEKQLVKALPKMAKAAESEELRAAFEEHLEITRQHVGRLEEVFKGLGMAARGKPCEG